MTDESKTGRSSPELASSPAPSTDEKLTTSPPSLMSDSSAAPSALQSAWPSGPPTPGPQTDKEPGMVKPHPPATFDSAWPNTTTDGPSSPDVQQDRAILISRARQFLTSAHLAPAPLPAKRAFLVGKGLTPSEVDALLRELPPQIPRIPPRTYPVTPPSNLPNIILAVVRIYSWFVGGSAFFLTLYYRFILPRWTRTTQARQAIRSHQVELLRRFATSLSKFKEAQSESFSVLPRPLPSGGRELPAYSKCKSLEELCSAFDQSKKEEEGRRKVTKAEGVEEENAQRASPEEGFEVSVLRCAILQFEKENQGRKPSAEQIFTLIGEKAKWVGDHMGSETYQNDLWEVLSSCSLFVSEPPTDDPSRLWTYVPPAPSLILASQSALTKKLSALPSLLALRTEVAKQTLGKLIECTRWLTEELYVMPLGMRGAGGIEKLTGGWMGTEAEEVRKEIRALKGLVLNRRSFLPRSGSASAKESAQSTS